MRNRLYDNLTLHGAKAQYDRCAKEFLSIRYVLGYIMIHAIKEYQGCTIEEAMASIEGDPVISRKNIRTGHIEPEIIQTRAQESTSSENGEIYYDIVFYAHSPHGERQKLWINVEAQKSFYPGYDLVTRGLFYGARLLSDELDKEFYAGSYDDVKKVYSIWICMNPPGRDRMARSVENTIVEYHITPTLLYAEHETDIARVHTGRYDLITTIVVYLARDGISENELVGMLSTLFSNVITPECKIQILSEQYRLPMTVDMEEEVNTMCYISDWIVESTRAEEQERYEAEIAEIKADRDAVIAAKDARIAQLEAQLAAVSK